MKLQPPALSGQAARHDDDCRSHSVEYNTWENDQRGAPRHAFQGVLGAVEYTWTDFAPGHGYFIQAPRILAQYETGYEPAFRHHTFQLEFGAKLLDLPVALWYRDGYGQSLARYYKKTRAFGIELRFVE